jgi:hypothetical protein
VIAMTMPISTKTTIATCIQIQVGDIATKATARHPARGAGTANIVCAWQDA